uniref:Uncharacterized protein n=2 Tax=Homalodisca TaxID=139475 RepID=A0A1B6J690_9HEMI
MEGQYYLANNVIHQSLANSPPFNGGGDQAAYSFQSSPRALFTTRKKYKHPPGEDGTPLPYGNIMYDRRVVRGSTFAQHPVPAAGCESQAARQAEARRRSMARRKAQTQQTRAMRLRIGTPP